MLGLEKRLKSHTKSSTKISGKHTVHDSLEILSKPMMLNRSPREKIDSMTADGFNSDLEPVVQQERSKVKVIDVYNNHDHKDDLPYGFTKQRDDSKDVINESS